MVIEQYSIHRLQGDRDALVVILQSAAARTQNTRVVAPLLEIGQVPPLGKLNPQLRFEGRHLAIAVDQLASLPERLIGRKVGTCDDLRYEITRALDLLFQGS